MITFPLWIAALKIVILFITLMLKNAKYEFPVKVWFNLMALQFAKSLFKLAIVANFAHQIRLQKVFVELFVNIFIALDVWFVICIKNVLCDCSVMLMMEQKSLLVIKEKVKQSRHIYVRWDYTSHVKFLVKTLYCFSLEAFRAISATT